MKTAIFLDTNIFLHYKHFEEIDFFNLVESESITILISITILKELDKHKDQNQNSNIRQRAKKIITFLDQLNPPSFEMNLKNGISLRLIPKEPSIDFPKYQLDPTIPDDRIIASILEYKQENPEEDIVFISADTAPRKKAQFQSIKTQNLPSNLKLALNIDKNEKRIRELEKEIQLIKNRFPIIELKFDNELEYKEFQLYQPFVFSSNDIEKLINEIKKIHPKAVQNEDGSFTSHENGMGGLVNKIGLGPTDDQYIEFNKKLEDYYSGCLEYIDKWTNHINRNNITIKLQFMICNSGTLPAEDIDIFIHIPDGCTVVEEDDLADVPPSPKIPQKPRSALVDLSETVRNLDMSTNSIFQNTLHNSIRTVRIDSLPKIKKTNSYEVNFHEAKLKHDNNIILHPIFLIFDSFDTAASLSIEYKLNAGNIPKSIEGKLNLIIKKEETDQKAKRLKDLFSILT